MSNTEPFDNEHDAQDDDAKDFAGFDAFWAEQLRKERAEHGQQPTEVIRGITVNVPQDLPMRFRAKARAMRDQDGDDAFKELLAALFGVDVLDAWDKAGMGAREFRVILAWAMASGEGTPITWQEAYEAVMSKEDGEGEGKASTRESGESANGGRSSKRTSAGSTSSRRRK
ncbi:hypothetical protein [Nonomuraea wenchangensis]|uniref:hypothetical protein n=1 Tax=Nonomuraea wenchangensis TaxID=568860 RepID=UPI003322B7C7